MLAHDLLKRHRRKVLVIHPAALGDVLLARPALQALRWRYPQHEMAFIGGRAVGMLLQDCGEVDQVFPVESAYLSELFAGSEYLSREFRNWLEDADAAVGWLADREGIVAGTLRAMGVPSIQLQPALSTDYRAQHQSDRYCEALRLEGGAFQLSQRLILPSGIREQGQRILQGLNVRTDTPLVVVHAGSGSVGKCIESWRLAQVIQWLITFGADPLLLQGPADQMPVEAVLSFLPYTVPVVRGESLSGVAGVVSHAALYIGQDSGITHLAAALAIPTIVCFGPTDPRRWVPRGSQVTVLTGPRCACPSWREVEMCGERACLHISPERIIEASRAYLIEPAHPHSENA
ncbi:MAG: hypothetical protein GDA68_08200 [Nitrospira sp. CR2.1]|nr:hypothetical protein [Nitrospira sp. CR2.1]